MTIEHFPAQQERFIVTIHFAQYRKYYQEINREIKINQDILDLISSYNVIHYVDCGDFGEGLPILKVIFQVKTDAENFAKYMDEKYLCNQ